jgi:hypothetical protein
MKPIAHATNAARRGLGSRARRAAIAVHAAATAVAAAAAAVCPLIRR